MLHLGKSLVMLSLIMAAWIPSASALPHGDLNCDGFTNVVDIVMNINLSLGFPLSEGLDANQDGLPDACEGAQVNITCGEGTLLDSSGLVCLPALTQTELDAAYISGYDEGYAAGVASTSDPDPGVPLPEYLLLADFNNDWDAALATIGEQSARLIVDGPTMLGLHSAGDVTLPATLELKIEAGMLNCGEYQLVTNGLFSSKDEGLLKGGSGGFIFHGVDTIHVPWFSDPSDAWRVERAIQAAISSTAKVIYFPPGAYHLNNQVHVNTGCLLYTSPSPRD